MVKHWEYSELPSTVGLMVCTACHKPITEGQYRYRETEAAYLPQHRACSISDPRWAQMDAEAAKRGETDRIIDELETLAADLKFGLEPSNVALLEAVRLSLQLQN